MTFSTASGVVVAITVTVVTAGIKVFKDGRFTLHEEGDVDGRVAMVDPGRHLERDSADVHAAGGQQPVEAAAQD